MLADLLVFSNSNVPQGCAVVVGNRAYVHPDDYERGKSDPAHFGGLKVIALDDPADLSLKFIPSVWSDKIKE